MKKLLSFLLALMLLCLPALSLAETVAHPAGSAATITVTGSAAVTLQADYARVSVGVSTSAPTVAEATEQNNQLIHAVIDALLAAGIAEEDVATSSYNVHAEYDYSSGTSVMKGFNVVNQLTVIIRDMEHIGATLDKATAAGANSIYNIEFLSTKSAEAQDEAMVYAMADALRKAEMMAEAMHLEAGSILSIQENAGSVYVMARAYDSAVAEKTSNSILPGDATVNASVTIVFELK